MIAAKRGNSTEDSITNHVKDVVAGPLFLRNSGEIRRYMKNCYDTYSEKFDKPLLISLTKKLESSKKPVVSKILTRL